LQSKHQTSVIYFWCYCWC